MLVLVTEESELVQGVIKDVVARPAWARLVGLDLLHDVQELGRCTLPDLA